MKLMLFVLTALCALQTYAALCTNATCEYNFVITSRLTMSYPTQRGHYTYVKDGDFYYMTDEGAEVKVPDDQVDQIVAADGFWRIVTVVNGQLPGPAIEVMEGAEIVVNVENRLENEATTLHWHGLFQRGTPWMDGVSQITQCGILPATSFTYRFKAEPAGTHWYHSHHGLQRSDGVFGALIVHAKNPETLHNKYCNEENEFHLILNDWYHESNVEILWKRVGTGYFPNGADKPQTPWTFGFDGKITAEVPFTSALINGRGRFNNSEYEILNGCPSVRKNKVPLTTYNVKPNSIYCFRTIGAMMEKNFELSIDGHPITVIASDGFEVEPVTVDTLHLHGGERYDFFVKTQASVPGDGNIWVRAQTTEHTPGIQNHQGLAIMRYEGAPIRDPVSSRTPCTASKRCKSLNCPYPAFPTSYYKDCIHIDALRSYEQSFAPNFPEPDFEEYFLNFVFEPLGVNRRSFSVPSAPLLTQFGNDTHVACDNKKCDYESCTCTHYQTIEYNKTVQLVLTNFGRHAAAMHPVHLHGHAFWVLQTGFPDFDPETGKLLSNITSNIECINGTVCAVQQWKPGFPKDLNLINAPRKDTVVVAPGAYVVVRFVTDNPGWWHLHCHMTQHLYFGLGMVINAAPQEQKLFPPPKGFPTCGNFNVLKEGGINESVEAWKKLNNKQK